MLSGVGGQFVVGSLDDCVVNEVRRPSGEVAVQICVTEHTRILFTQNVEVALKLTSSAMVPVLSHRIHGTQVLDCGRVLLITSFLALRSTAKGKWSHVGNI